MIQSESDWISQCMILIGQRKCRRRLVLEWSVFHHHKQQFWESKKISQNFSRFWINIVCSYQLNLIKYWPISTSIFSKLNKIKTIERGLNVSNDERKYINVHKSSAQIRTVQLDSEERESTCVNRRWAWVGASGQKPYTGANSSSLLFFFLSLRPENSQKVRVSYTLPP